VTEIPVLEGEEWWSSAAIDDADQLIRSVSGLADACITQGINSENALALRSSLERMSPITGSKLNTSAWEDFCSELSNTKLAGEADLVQKKISSFITRYLSFRSVSNK